MQTLSPFNYDDIDLLSANVIRGLAMDGVQKADSGHPGMPMGMATVAHVLWTRFLRHNPGDPQWPDRDRFVLSGGHGSMLLYSLLHLAGYAVPMEQLKQFRQLGSITPGHPEYGVTPGVETTTGPLGQGFATGVGMALTEPFLAATFNRPDYPIVDHYTYVFAGDGDMEEGHQPRSRLARRAPEAGKADLLLRRQPASPLTGRPHFVQRRRPACASAAYGWHVQRVNAYDMPGIAEATQEAQRVSDRAIADHLPFAHRLRQPQQAGHRRGARRARWAKRKSG